MKEQPIKKIRYIFEILNPLANSEYHWILSVITFPLPKIDFKIAPNWTAIILMKEQPIKKFDTFLKSSIH